MEITYCLNHYVSGNKSDLGELRQVPFDKAAEFAERHQIFLMLETSAKENVNIEEAFVSVARVCHLDIVALYMLHLDFVAKVVKQ